MDEETVFEKEPDPFRFCIEKRIDVDVVFEKEPDPFRFCIEKRTDGDVMFEGVSSRFVFYPLRNPRRFSSKPLGVRCETPGGTMRNPWGFSGSYLRARIMHVRAYA